MHTADIQRIIQSYAERYPPLLTVKQAAEIAQCPIGTIHDWSHQQRLDHLKARCGRQLRLDRDAFVRFLLVPDEHHDL